MGLGYNLALPLVCLCFLSASCCDQSGVPTITVQTSAAATPSLPSWTLSSRTVSLGKPFLPYFLSITAVRKVRDTVTTPLTHRQCMAHRKCKTNEDIPVKLWPPSYKGESHKIKGRVVQLPWGSVGFCGVSLLS